MRLYYLIIVNLVIVYSFLKNNARKFRCAITLHETSIRNPVQNSSTPIVIIGAGMSGLSCARNLVKGGKCDLILLDSQNNVGGRAQTDKVQGYLLDRGFQVLIDSYPEVSRNLKASKLNLKRFQPGALIKLKDEMHLMADPLRYPSGLMRTIGAPVGTINDKLKVIIPHEL